MRRFSLTRRQMLVVAHDLFATAAAVIVSFYVRFEAAGLESRIDGLIPILPGFVLYAGFIYFLFGIHEAKWRFTSLPDFGNIVRARDGAGGLAARARLRAGLAGDVRGVFLRQDHDRALLVRSDRVPGRKRALPTVISATCARATMRARGRRFQPWCSGRAADAEVLLRAIESGAASQVRPIGILSPSTADRGQSIRGIPVVGGLDDLELVLKDVKERGARVSRLIFTASALVPEVAPEAILMRARRLGLQTSRLPSLVEGGEALQLAPVAVEDLLLRPSVAIDYDRLEHFIRGKSIVVTGGGGSIGAEICDRVIAFGAARLLVVEHSEVALHTVLEVLRAKAGNAEVDGRIADVRDRERIAAIFADYKPEIVFHAAALKHVPLLERDWGEGVKTNVFGSVNVADAAAAAGAAAMVMISTDKAIEPVSVLGATKRFAEMYCQALDADFARR
jgi:O-antigen biosynthesis protein WbqV